MKKKTVLVLLGVFWVSLGFGQSYRVYFKDKGSSRTLMDQPELFLSAEALERRTRQGLKITESDLPLAREYRRQLKNLGLSPRFCSRWFNYALVDGPIPAELYRWEAVKAIEKVRPANVHFTGSLQSNYDYGNARTQIDMLNGIVLHGLGWTGRGVTIAVLDGGFSGTETAAAFDSLWQSGRLKGSYDFVRKDTNVFRAGMHGTMVLSTMAALIDQQYVGTAPHANYWLLRSEDENSETPVEMDNWLAAAEFADSVGADLINSSLGYSTFDDPADNYTYADMDGATTLVTRAADMAAAKGLVVVVSAGNAGASSWQYITAPADGDSVLAVGAVNASESYAAFSSRGPTADGRIKPDVVALGEGTPVVLGNNVIFPANGTSFSSPLIAGMAACIIQVRPSWQPWEVIEAIRQSASQSNAPDNRLGYGIPDFTLASHLSEPEYRETAIPELELFPTPFRDRINVRLVDLRQARNLDLQIFDLRGQRVFSAQTTMLPGEDWVIRPELPLGIYILELQTDQQRWQLKINRR